MERGNYNSGSDWILEFGSMRFTFSEPDLSRRVEQAARELELLPERDLYDLEREDLVALMIDGEPRESPATKFGAHLRDHWDEIQDPACREWGLPHWLRRLVFRQAWIDQRILEGELEPKFTRRRGFVYVDPFRTVEDREVKLSKVPSFEEYAYDDDWV